ncbi:MAG: ABC transporter ATP-binding protein [Cyanobacteria bacterium P01_C01_bin.73]
MPQLWSNFPSRLRATLATTPKLLRLVWQASPLWFLAVLGITALTSLLPVGWLYINKLIVDWLALLPTETPAPLRQLVILVALRFGLALVRSVLGELQPYVSQVLGDRFSLHASQKLLQQSIRLDLSHYESSQFHEALSRAQQSGSSYPVRALNNFITILGQSINLVGVIGLLIRFNALMVGLLFLSTLPTLGVGVAYSNKGFALMRKKTFSSRLAGYFQGLLIQQNFAKEIRLYNLGAHFLRRWQHISQEQQQEMQGLALKRAIARFQIGIIPSLGFYGAYSWVIVQTVRSQITLGDFTLYSGAFSQAQSLLTSLLENLSTTYEANLYVAQYLEFLQLRPSIVSPAQPSPFPPRLQQGITFNKVCFSYPGAARPTLTQITLTLSAGENVALVGVNGVGKTTLVKLLTRLYDATAGEIHIDGIPIEQFAVTDLRRNIAVLFQDFAHYQLSVRDNISLGSLDANDDFDRIVQAARSAGIHDWIESLPQGYETKLGNLYPKGRNLSGGQWQKIGLARAFMSSAQILILDEPTAALDAIAEFELFNQFRQLTAGRTTLFTSHRFSSVRLADRILVLDNGRIVEAGTHQTLMESAGIYAEMFRLQAEGYQP